MQNHLPHFNNALRESVSRLGTAGLSNTRKWTSRGKWHHFKTNVIGVGFLVQGLFSVWWLHFIYNVRLG